VVAAHDPRDACHFRYFGESGQLQGDVAACVCISQDLSKLPILSSLRASSTNLMTLLNTALDYTRLREGAIDYSVESFAAAQVVKEVSQSFRPYAMAKQFEIEVQAPAALTVLGDAVRFRQIVNNLVSNAVKFTPHGFVQVLLEHAGGNLRCTVTDSGPGIPQDEQENVFKPFVSLQLGAILTEPGSGLGLAVSKQLVDQQNGSLTLISPVEGGASFALQLPYPLGTEATTEPALEAELRPFESQALRILYVEDVASNQQVMALTLEGRGHELVCADNGADALKLVAAHSFDLVLMDLQLPDMNGYELAVALRTSNHRIPLIAVTAQASDKTRRQCLDAGMDAVVLKPFSAEALFSAISKSTRQSFARELRALHGDDTARSRALATTMAREFRSAANALVSLQDSDLSGWKDTLHQIQHKLKTAVVRFQLKELDSILNELSASAHHDRVRLKQAAQFLETAASDLNQWAENGL
jgi:CheY-like chemotaxis protein